MHEFQCQQCNNQILYTSYIRSPFCEKADCQRAKVQHFLDQNKKQIISSVKKETTSACNEYVKNNSATNNKKSIAHKLAKISFIDSSIIAILPVNTKPLVQLTDKRKNDFLLHLTTLYNDIMQENPSSTKIYATQLDSPLEEKESQLLGMACATCMGECCSLGKEHAFQDTTSLTFFLNGQFKTLELSEVIQVYSQFFPNQSYENSCIFHGNMGCTLPSELRSFTCKNYRCQPLRSYHQELIKNKHELTIAAAAKEKNINKISIFNEEDFITIK